MVRVSVTEARSSWKIKPPHDAQTQGLIVSAFTDLCWSEALFLRFDAPGGAWLNLLQGPAAITDARGQVAQAAAIGFTWTGLQKLGLEGLDAKDTRASFAAPFQEGMHQEDRLRRLGDTVNGKWANSVIEGGPLWSGDEPPQGAGQALPAAGAATVGQPQSARCTVHAIILLYDSDRVELGKRASELSRELEKRKVITVRQLSLDLRLDKANVAREHFGFADGLSQPIPYGESIIRNGRPAQKDPVHGVPAGEFLIGHLNAHHEKAPGPIVPRRSRMPDVGLTAEGVPEGFLNFGLNGSYMVVRELRQDVASFWNSFANAAKGTAAQSSASRITADWLAERAIGRSLNGDLLCPSGYLPPKGGAPDNDFKFFDSDHQGRGCPLGSHVRRTNPRDGLAKDKAAAQSALDAANNHRILRRGRKYGSTIADRCKDDGEDRGLLFICLNTDIARQFEFVQQTWLLNRNFATLYDETDPLVGPKGPFTIPENPFRRIVEVDTFIRMAGGEYFFLPSIPALKYLAAS
jgi:Dyp-type peroxidase family